jgi:hypothetical protein
MGGSVALNFAEAVKSLELVLQMINAEGFNKKPSDNYKQ